ncbi:PP2C-family Ser/Thr phosphatase [Corynebacterium provencense]|uniref:PP2C-family Ser/Thr phosphatase n=1 Tax=Corynebacterium provencense TaxID=1737425 RepID=A0A2Z3YLJ7_9CORY|nr:protein phosphatase 2C domain-containing protein [Corynebacterium provencense]AWT24925.1 PP2C-family Ser/Thr phosphatase [Corynebacterium provencense]
MTLALDYAARSDRGLVRGNNEDSAVAASHLLALADGMGGHAAGEVASQLMIEALFPLNTMFGGDPVPADRLPAMLVEAMEDGNRAIAAHVDENPTLEGMGCTLSALLFNDGRLGVCHVGDSRGYLLRDGVLTQITKDDTYVQSLVDEGKLDPADVSSHPQRSLILKALTGRAVEPTLQLRDALPGDRYMLCSDGLSDPVSADTIRDVLAEGTPTEAAEQLINLALRGGGPDNVTVVVADVVDVTDRDDSAPELPTEVALAGAIDSEATELPRPDTAAGRAMAVNIVNRSAPSPSTGGTTPAARGNNGRNPRRTSRTVPAADDGAADDAPSDGDGRSRRTRRRVLVALTVLVLLVAVVGVGGFIAKRSLNDSYYVAVAAESDLPTPSAVPTSTTTAPGPSTSPAPADPADPTDPGAPAAPGEAGGQDDAGQSDRNRPSAAQTTAPATGQTPATTTRATPATSRSAGAATEGTPIIIYQGAPGSFLGISLHSAYQEICLDRDASVRLLPAGSTDSCHRFSTADLTPAARGTLDTLPRDSYQSIQDQLRRLSAQTLPVCVTRNSDESDGDPADLTTPGVSCREVN